MDARIYSTTVVKLATGEAVTSTPEPRFMEVKLPYKITWSGIWNSSVSLKLYSGTNIDTDIPVIEEGRQIGIPAHFKEAYKWGTTRVTTTDEEIVHEVTVEPMTKVEVILIATNGSCNVPFSYSQHDTLKNGQTVTYDDMDDGIYTVNNCYNLDFEIHEVKLFLPKKGYGGFESDFDGIEDDFVSKVNSSTDDHVKMKMNQVSNCSYDELEALTEEIEDEGEIVGEVLRIKGILANSQDEVYPLLLSLFLFSIFAGFSVLTRGALIGVLYSLMEYCSIHKKTSIDGTLCGHPEGLGTSLIVFFFSQATEIGKAVNGLRKHGSKEIRHLVSAAAAIAEGSPDSVNPSVVDDEEGLPSPSMDEGVFFATQAISMEFSQFFDGMDDDGSSRNSGEINKNRENGRKSSVENHNIIKRKQQQQLPHKANEVIKDKKDQQEKQVAVIKQTKPSNTESGPGKPPKPNSVQKFSNETKFQQKSGNVAVQKRQLAVQQDKSKCSNEDSVQMKLEASKQKLHQGYLQADNGSCIPL
ncbi:hypothetical protein HHK36_019689 [Tetracentron sinense]|uniref:TFIIS N-terminal domain-containing protein n=1 Tax=Tetracentron sinense TaxID=13715 RepID=A0A834Z0C3_TETSI|nr:hypothetical protein HHK36_019689 [Tetracentron sinense]